MKRTEEKLLYPRIVPACPAKLDVLVLDYLLAIHENSRETVQLSWCVQAHLKNNAMPLPSREDRFIGRPAYTPFPRRVLVVQVS